MSTPKALKDIKEGDKIFKSINPYFCSSYKNSRGLLQWSGGKLELIVSSIF